MVAIFGTTTVEDEPPSGRTVGTAAASCGCCARPLARNLPPGSISTDSTTAPAIGFGAAGCDSTTVGLPGVMSATTGRSAGPGSIATATLCLDVACLPSGCLEQPGRDHNELSGLIRDRAIMQLAVA